MEARSPATAVLAVLPERHRPVHAAEAHRGPGERLVARHTDRVEGQVNDDRTGPGEEDRAVHRTADIVEAGRTGAALAGDNGHLVEDLEEGRDALAAGEGLAEAGNSRPAGEDSLAEGGSLVGEEDARVVVVGTGPEEGMAVARSLGEADRTAVGRILGKTLPLALWNSGRVGIDRGLSSWGNVLGMSTEGMRQPYECASTCCLKVGESASSAG